MSRLLAKIKWLGFDGQWVNFKVDTRSDVRKFETTYLLKDSTDFDEIKQYMLPE